MDPVLGYEPVGCEDPLVEDKDDNPALSLFLDLGCIVFLHGTKTRS